MANIGLKLYCLSKVIGYVVDLGPFKYQKNLKIITRTPELTFDIDNPCCQILRSPSQHYKVLSHNSSTVLGNLTVLLLEYSKTPQLPVYIKHTFL